MKTKFANLLKITLAICGMLLLSNSCTEEKYIESENSTQWGVHERTVIDKDWKWDNNEKCYFYRFEMNQLTSALVKEGVVLAAIKINNNVYKTLENTEYFHIKDNTTGELFLITETVNYVYGVGFIEFRVQASDAFGKPNSNYAPETMTFKVTTIY